MSAADLTSHDVDILIPMALLHGIEQCHRNFHTAGPWGLAHLHQDAARAKVRTFHRLTGKVPKPIGGLPHTWNHCGADCRMQPASTVRT